MCHGCVGCKSIGADPRLKSTHFGLLSWHLSLANSGDLHVPLADVELALFCQKGTNALMKTLNDQPIEECEWCQLTAALVVCLMI